MNASSTMQPVLDEVNITLDQTKNNDGLTLVLALNYGSRAEITDAVRICIILLSSFARIPCNRRPSWWAAWRPAPTTEHVRD